MRRLILILGLAAGLAAVLPTKPAEGQFAATRRTPGAPPPTPMNNSDPVAFTADEVQYDRDNATVTATGNVEAWQNDHVLRADRITFDRNTNVAAAAGNVVIVEPDGQVLFSDYAELTEGMRDGVLKGMRAILAENGKLVANGARRTQGNVNELSRVVYTTCNLCATDPTKPPLWQLRARSAVQDLENKRIEYRDAVLDIYGVPVFGFPYLWHADPSVKRASGFLIPSFGQSTPLGAFLSTPYYWAIDDISDATFTPTFNTKNYLNLNTEYRRHFNDGVLTVNTGLGYDQGKPAADIFATGKFAYDDTWRYGFDLNRASSAQYLQDYRVSNRGDVLTSRVYLEGFGTGSYTKVDAIAYQGLVGSIKQSRLPYVLPRYTYSFFGEPDALGGRLRFDTQSFNIVRETGTNTRRVGGSLNWERPFQGLLGEQYGFTLRADGAAYSASALDQNPNYYSSGSAQLVQVQPTAALIVRWPLVRNGGGDSTQLIEPIAQVIAAPNAGRNRNSRVPYEDSLDFELTDQNLFSLNRYSGIDRQEGGVRANLGMHLNYTSGTTVIDGLIGQSYRLHKDDSYPPLSGLGGQKSDIVTRATVSPTDWLDLTGRTRFNHRTFNVTFADALASLGTDKLRVGGGYIYSLTNPYFLYDQATIPSAYYQHRNEATVTLSTRYKQYSFSGYARRDLQRGTMTSVGVHANYEDECFIFDVNFARRYTSLNGDNGATTILFQLTFKTVGQFGFHAS